MFSLNKDKSFNSHNHPFVLGFKGDSYQTFTEQSGRKLYQFKAVAFTEGTFTWTFLGNNPIYIDKLPPNLPTTAAEKLAYFSGRIINSIFSVPFHTVRTIVDISLQIFQTIAFVFEFGAAKLASKFSISYNPTFSVSHLILTIRQSSGCCGAMNRLAERLFLIDKHTSIKSFSIIIRQALR